MASRDSDFSARIAALVGTPERRKQFVALVQSLEIPDCKCKPKLIPFCLYTTGESCVRPACVTWENPDGCAKRQRRGKCSCPQSECECPVLPGDPCAHILSVLDHWPVIDGEPLTFDQWLAFVRAPEAFDPPIILEPEEMGYGDRVPPPCGSRAKLHEAHVAEYEGRLSNGFSLWHPDDVWRDNGRALTPTLSKVNVQAGKGKRQIGHAVVKHDKE